MSSMPSLLVTSVVRGSEQGESHGGVYLVNCETGNIDHKLDWDTCEINFEGRGADRGLRGIAYYGDQILIAASDEIFFFDQDFRILNSVTSPYLKHCHEICIWEDRLYLTSTGFDSILIYDLLTDRFCAGYYIASNGSSYKCLQYDPVTGPGPKASNHLHINTVSHHETGLYFSGRKANYLFRLFQGQLSSSNQIPRGTHNAQLLDGQLVYNDTQADQVVYHGPNGVAVRAGVPAYDRADIINIERYESQIARPGFGRGLCRVSDSLLAAGSSPSTVAIHSITTGEIVRSFNISMDVRNAVHGLEVWPY